MSLGQDLRWKRRTVKTLQVNAGGLYLDVGAGTGDLARRLRGQFRQDARIIAVDASRPMLLAGGLPRQAGIECVVGDAQDLPFRDGCVDGIVTGFLLRNLAQLPGFFASAHRVLKPGSRLVILEIAYPDGRLQRALFHAYFHGILPLLGGLVTGRPKAYAYLSRSLRTFPTPTQLTGLAATAGFHEIDLRRGPWTGMFVLVLERRANQQNSG
ncbi:MAG: class I SAM-dependent methyltransferase [Thermoplasmatota archaeon]